MHHHRITIALSMFVIVAGTGFLFSLFIEDLLKPNPKSKGMSGSVAIFIRIIITPLTIKISDTAI